jgi:phosphatidylethanolamine-binding protein (PEBP) family uncharacterized protein
VHTCYFNAYGFDAKLDVRPGSTREDLEEAMAGHMVQNEGLSIATYQR